MTLTEFLLARITEDESNDTTLVGVERKDWTARWLAECEAKRRIVEDFESQDAGSYSPGYAGRKSDTIFGQSIGLERAVRNLAAVYADHPDYRQEWA